MAGIVTYQHIQSTHSDKWNISHNLGVFPIVDVLVNIDGTLTKIIPMDIILVDENNIRIEFSKPFSGSARMV